MDSQMTHPQMDDELDLRARAELSLAFQAGEPPAQLFRHTPLLSRRWFQVCCALCLTVGTTLGAVLAVRPPELVRSAIEHEYYERTLRGSFMDASVLLGQLGLDTSRPVPGYAQLMRPCDIQGRLAYHLTTFFEKGGLVTVFAFDQPVELAEGEGWWNDVYWQIVAGPNGRPVLMVSEKKRALTVAQRVFSRSPV